MSFRVPAKGLCQQMQPIRFFVLLIMAICFSGEAPASNGPEGQWDGAYTCVQGRTALSLTITARDETHFSALFHFRPIPSNPTVPEGCFKMNGIFNSGSRQLVFSPGDWILKPRGYVTVGLSGILDETSQNYDGKITGGFNCTIFHLSRSMSQADTSNACGELTN